MFVSLTSTPALTTAKFSTTELYVLLFQQTIVYCTFALLTLFIITVLLVKFTSAERQFTTTFNVIKYLNIIFGGFILVCVVLKFAFFTWNLRSMTLLLINFNSIGIRFKYLLFTPVFDLNNSILSDVVILLAFSSGLVCLYLLGEKNLANKLSNISIFCIFLVATVAMVYTTNLLVMFVGFECLFLPTLYFVFSHGYIQRTDKATKILLYWTLLGAFLVLTSLAYVFYKYKSLHYFYLTTVKFSELESNVLFCLIFLGFGIKVPVFPFHYWLTKIHVEAPAGFSIFLSGFLVKAALFCFYYFNLVFTTKFSTQLVTAVAIFGVLEASVKMWTQTDFKKLIAFATIQEMNLILFLLVSYQNTLDYNLVLFILVHGWLSTLMFFLVDVVQKKTRSRNITEIAGLAYKFHEIKVIFWIILIFFSGFPLTVKFLVEWAVLGTLVLHHQALFMLVFLGFVVFGVVGFAKQIIILLYGAARPEPDDVSYVLSKRDRFLFSFILYMLFMLNFLNFTLS